MLILAWYLANTDKLCKYFSRTAQMLIISLNFVLFFCSSKRVFDVFDIKHPKTATFV